MWGEILMKHTAIRIPEEIIEELRRIAVQNERSLSGEIRLALRQYLRGCTGQRRKRSCASAEQTECSARNYRLSMAQNAGNMWVFNAKRLRAAARSPNA
jgi:hypothetical protein